jgi:putative ABC transport system permease protein
VNARRAAARLYLLALYAFPREHRARYSAEMLEAFARTLGRHRAAGAWGASRFVLAACLDAVRSGAGERRRRPPSAGGRGPLFSGSIGRDLAHAARSLARARAFTFVCVTSLGIGMGAVFTLLAVVRVLIGSPPGIATNNLVELLVIPQEELKARVGDWAIDTWSYPDFLNIRDADTGMTVAGWTAGQSILRLPDGAGVRLDTMYASPNYFAVAGASLAQGRGFDSKDSAAEPQVIVSHRLWRTRFASTPGIIGSALVVNSVPHVVVGVTAEGFRGHLALHRPGFQIWLPLAEDPRIAGRDSHRFDRDADWVRVLGRLLPGRSLVEANAVVSSIMAATGRQHPASNRLKTASVEPYFPTGARGRFDTIAEATTLVTGAGIVLLVVCLNLSGMVLVRSAIRERELALRLAIGANRARLVQYLLSEAVVLAIAGGALAAAVAFGTPAVLSWWFQTPTEEVLGVDGTVLAACTAVCFTTTFIFGLMPAIRFSRPAVMSALKDEVSGGGRRVGRIHRLTVALQAGIAVPFLVIGGVQLDQARKMATIEPGFEPAELFALPLDLAAVSRRDADPAFVLRSIQSQLERATGVSSVAAANGLPLDFEARHARVVRDGSAESVRAHTTRVSARFFDAAGIRLLRGRAIGAEDRAGSAPVAVISQALATRLFADGEPLGKRLTFALDSSLGGGDFRWSHVSMPSREQTFTVIGVTGDLVDAYMGPPAPQLFVSLAQQPSPRVFVIARSSSTRDAMGAAFERAVADFYADPDVIRSGLVTGESLLRRSRGELVFGSALGGVAGGVALLLEALGIFGVVAFMVATRTREIGIRIALGASRPRVLGGVLLDAVKVAVPGATGGLLLAFAAAGEVAWASQGAVTPLLYSAAVTTALAVAIAAALPAARRAASVEPIVAMRSE